MRGRRRAEVLVCSSGGVRNMGDDAILLRTAERIRAQAPRARIDVLTDELGPIPGFRGLQPVGRTGETARVADGHYDLVVIAGGGFACDTFASHVTTRRQIAEAAAARDIPVIVTGQGIGPVTRPELVDDLRAIAGIARGIAVRDETSREQLAAIGVAAEVTGDDTLGLAGERAWRPRHPYLAVHLREASYHTTDADARAAWVHAATKLADTRSWRVVGLAVNDRAEAPEAATLASTGIARVVDATRDPRRAVRVTAHAAGVVSHSYHVALFALAHGTPAVLAAANPYYAQKGEGLRQLAGLSDALIATEPPDAAELADRLDEVRAGLEHNRALIEAAQRVDAFFSREWERAQRPPSTARDIP